LKEKLKQLFTNPVELIDNLIVIQEEAEEVNQKLTNKAFSEKWKEANKQDIMTGGGLEFQKNWYLQLYGFNHFDDLKNFLSDKEVVLDAGCGPGYKSAMFAELSPETLVIGMDFSEAIYIAKDKYKHLDNLFFIKGDIADTHLRPDSIDYVSCDQVLHHTSNPPATFEHLTSITKKGGDFATYVYAKKALSRELLDDYFRNHASDYSNEELWEMSRQLTELGKRLSELKIEVDIPAVPLLGIKGGKQDLQRFIHWDFMKCFWNEQAGWDYSVTTNFDWYSPTNAFRYSETEFRTMINNNHLDIIHFHAEPACFAGRFRKPAE